MEFRGARLLFTYINFLYGQSDLGIAVRKATLLSDHDPMSLTTEERVEREKQRREAANTQIFRSIESTTIPTPDPKTKP